MCKVTKDFTIISDNGSKKFSFNLKKVKDNNEPYIKRVNKIFTDSMNNCKSVQMKKTHILITM